MTTIEPTYELIARDGFAGLHRIEEAREVLRDRGGVDPRLLLSAAIGRSRAALEGTQA